MKYKISPNNKSVLNSGLTDDYKRAVAEYIWNGFDAGATCVEIVFNANGLGGVDDLHIEDNGSGIDYDMLPETFGTFLDSNRTTAIHRTSNVRGRKGKGRFSYNVISGGASWRTRYRDQNGELKEFEITIYSSNRAEYEVTEPVAVSSSGNKATGTSVHFLEMRPGFTEDNFTGDSFREFLSSEFAWFLELNREKDYSIKINGVVLDYSNLIGEAEARNIVIGEYNFQCNFIRWTKKIGDKYYFYLMNDQLQEVSKELTSFNNKATTFHHSIYVTSSYFNNFVWEKIPASRLDGMVNQGDAIYRRLLKELRKYLAQKEKEYIRAVGAAELIAQYERDDVLPKFSDDRYGRARKKDLIEAIQGIYYVQPKIFQNLSTEQRKTMVGFLNLLLDSNERNNLIEIIEGVVHLTSEERAELAATLRATSLSRINSTISLVKNRLLVVEGLKRLVFDLEKFTTERDHIQKIVEENYWLFGEQFSLASADDLMATALAEYTYKLDGKAQKGSFTAEDARRRPDIFTFRERPLSDYPHSSILEENIIVELKRPSLIIGKEQFRQIEDYRDIILGEPKFNSQRRRWIFIVVGKEVDDFIKNLYGSFEDKNKPGLVNLISNFEIYALTWDDVFVAFGHRENFVLEKLNFDKKVIHDEMAKYDQSRGSADNLTQDILNLNTK